MFDFIGKLATCIVTTCLLYTATFKSLGILQQAGYDNKAFWRWLKREDNLYFNRLTIWSALALFTASLASIATALLGEEVSLVAFASVCYLFSFRSRSFASSTVSFSRVRNASTNLSSNLE